MSIVQLSTNLRACIASLRDSSDRSDEAARLSAGYRENQGRAVTMPAPGKRAYLTTRLPATFAAVLRTLERVAETGIEGFETLLDAGCGPGTASLAAAEIWRNLVAVTRSDLDGSWRQIAESLGQASGHAALTSARWLTGALDQRGFPPHDAVIAAYALNEVPEQQRAASVRALWVAAQQCLILVEPGTPQGFMNIRAAREVLLAEGAQIAAPCTQHGDCPMSAQDWCHTSVRLARDAEHRAAKLASLPYEDEKFAFLAVTRAPLATRPSHRIVKRPKAQTGHVHLDLCGPAGLERQTVSRRDGAAYKAARKADWGDGWPP